MIILTDIGNSRTKYCVVNGSARSAPIAVANESLSNDFFNEHFIDASKVIVASVSDKELTEEIRTWCQLNNISCQSVVSESEKNNVVSAYQVPSQLGVDRWLALIGAAELFPHKNILIIDAGTATTFDLLAANGQHQGGWIMAGINTLISSVLANTTHVKASDREKESLLFGINTSENVHNAAWASTVGAVNLAITQAEQKGIILDEVIFTGGNGVVLSTLMSCQNRVIEDLVFSGLQAYT